MRLLSSNSKLDKRPDPTEHGDWDILGLSLAPGKLSGTEFCPARGACYSTCLYWQGHGRSPNVQAARLERSRRLLEDTVGFAADLHREIFAALRLATRKGRRLALRPNVLSDLDYTEPRFAIVGDVLAEARANGVVQYDYTKRLGKILASREARDGVRWAYSLSERSTLGSVAAALNSGAHVVAVGALAAVRSELAAALFSGAESLGEGDSHDLFFLREERILALAPKGTAKGAPGGFVLRIGDR